MLLILSNNPEDWRGVISALKMLHYWLNVINRFNYLSGKVSPWSLCNSEGIPQTGIIISNSDLPTVIPIALLQGKASTQCENIQIITKIIYILEVVAFGQSPIAIPQRVP